MMDILSFLCNIRYADLRSSSKSPRVTPEIYARRLFVTSSLIAIDVIVALTMGNLLDFVLLDSLSVLTSFNYWRDPRRDWRRTLDMMVGIPLFMYHGLVVYLELTVALKWGYFVMMMICFSLYMTGPLTNDRRLGQLTHSTMHIIGVAMNIFMYYQLSWEREYIGEPASVR